MLRSVGRREDFTRGRKCGSHDVGLHQCCLGGKLGVGMATLHRGTPTGRLWDKLQALK